MIDIYMYKCVQIRFEFIMIMNELMISINNIYY